MPTPVSSTIEHGVAAVGAQRRPESGRPGGVYLTALVTMLVSTCSSRTASPSTQTGSVLMSMVPIPAGVASDGGDRAADRLGHVDRLPIQPDLAGDDALDVEQIADQVRDVAHLSRDHVMRAVASSPSPLRQLENARRRC